MRSDVVPGAVFLDYELPDHTHAAPAERAAERGPDDPHARARALLPGGAMIPHTLVLKLGLVIHRTSNGYWFWGRPSVYDLWRDLREVTRKIRPDWDLAKPGLRQRWDAGDDSPFHGWNKTAGQKPDAD